MGGRIRVPVVSGPLAPWAAQYGSWLASREGPFTTMSSGTAVAAPTDVVVSNLSLGSNA